jgi:hypothetical protein
VGLGLAEAFARVCSQRRPPSLLPFASSNACISSLRAATAKTDEAQRKELVSNRRIAPNQEHQKAKKQQQAANSSVIIVGMVISKVQRAWVSARACALLGAQGHRLALGTVASCR